MEYLEQFENIPDSITLDDSDARIFDDAISVEWLECGFLIHVSIVDVADEKAKLKHQGKDFLGKTFRAFPHVYKRNRLSLRKGKKKKRVITTSIFVNENGELEWPSIQQTKIVVSNNFSFEEGDRILQDLSHPMNKMITDLKNVAESLLTMRNGTTILGALWNDIYISSGIVREFMTLANYAAGMFLSDLSVPALYSTDINENVRNLDHSPDVITCSREVDSELASPSYPSLYFDISPVDTSFMKMPAYTRVTSPMWRISDFINQQILVAILNGQPSPYDEKELAIIAEKLNKGILLPKQYFPKRLKFQKSYWSKRFTYRLEEMNDFKKLKR